MAITKQQIDAVEVKFNEYAQANLAFQTKRTEYTKWVNDKWFKPNVTIADYLEAEREGKPITKPQPTPEQEEVLALARASDRAKGEFRRMRVDIVSDFPEAQRTSNAKATESYIQQVDKLSISGKLAKTSDVMHDYKDTQQSYATLLQNVRERIAKAERAAEDAKRAKAAAKAAAAAKAEGIESLQETINLVTAGAIIKIDGTSKAHEPARVDVAWALEKYFGKLNADDAKALGLKEGDSLSMVDEDGITDRKLLGKALRVYQAQNRLVADGKIGPSTLEVLLETVKASEYPLGKWVIQAVTGERQVGHLGGKFNPFSLQTYDGDDAGKKAVKDEMTFVKSILGVLKTKVESQGVDGNYTQKEHDALKALFEGKGDKPAPLDPENLSNEGIKAFQKAFGIKVDKGVIGPEVARALAQINIRLNTDQVIDPSEIKAAVVANAKPVAKAEAKRS